MNLQDMKYVDILKGLKTYDQLFDADNFNQIDRFMIKIENGEIL